MHAKLECSFGGTPTVVSCTSDHLKILIYKYMVTFQEIAHIPYMQESINSRVILCKSQYIFTHPLCIQ